ncbi:MAG: IS21 family transposase [Acidimicrobiia bacterium]
MMTEEEFVRVETLRKAGWTISQIADELGYHPATVSKWLREGPPPPRRLGVAEPVIEDRWAARITELLEHNEDLLATSILRVLRVEGFEGGYSTLTRHLRAVRGVRRRLGVGSTVPIETGPGEEFQFDFSDCGIWARRWGWDHNLVCFGAVLCWSRCRSWWFTTSEDQAHTFEGIVLVLEDFGGVPRVGRTDRMGALGKSRGKRFVPYPATTSFCAHHGFELKACQTGDAARKGKVERPFGEMKSAFLPEMDLDPPDDVAELNRRAGVWLDRVTHPRPHRVTGVPPAMRIAAEREMLGRLPAVRFDTARRETRRVGRVPLIEWDTTFYSVPPQVVGAAVEVRQPVDAGVIEIRHGGALVATHRLDPDAVYVWDPGHRAATEAAALGRHNRPHLSGVPDMAGSVNLADLDLGDGDYRVDPPDLALLEAIGPAPRLDPAERNSSDRLSADDVPGSEGSGGPQ